MCCQQMTNEENVNIVKNQIKSMFVQRKIIHKFNSQLTRTAEWKPEEDHHQRSCIVSVGDICVPTAYNL